MDIKEFKELETDDYNGEYVATIGVEKAKIFHVTGFLDWEKHDPGQLSTLTENSIVVITELFAESEWGRSHFGCGELHHVKIKDLKRAYLINTFDLSESAQRIIFEEYR